jgi:hypothetical protein
MKPEKEQVRCDQCRRWKNADEVSRRYGPRLCRVCEAIFIRYAAKEVR